jgi:hypothetical protein
MKPFGYLQDKLFLSALSIYSLNKLLILPHFSGVLRLHAFWIWIFLHGHLDDLLLMPAALPVVLWVHRQLAWRKHDGPPGWGEMAGHLIIWSVVCKLAGPRYLHLGVADPWDLLCFAAGGMAACLWWHHKYPHPAEARHEF